MEATRQLFRAPPSQRSRYVLVGAGAQAGGAANRPRESSNDTRLRHGRNSGQGPVGYCSATALGFQTSVILPSTTLKISIPEMVDTFPSLATMSMSHRSVT